MEHIKEKKIIQGIALDHVVYENSNIFHKQSEFKRSLEMEYGQHQIEEMERQRQQKKKIAEQKQIIEDERVMKKEEEYQIIRSEAIKLNYDLILNNAFAAQTHYPNPGARERFIASLDKLLNDYEKIKKNKFQK